MVRYPQNRKRNLERVLAQVRLDGIIITRFKSCHESLAGAGLRQTTFRCPDQSEARIARTLPDSIQKTKTGGRNATRTRTKSSEGHGQTYDPAYSSSYAPAEKETAPAHRRDGRIGSWRNRSCCQDEPKRRPES
jgi:hypothetical protein